MLNTQKANMYNWISHTWNTVQGRCKHRCSYCYNIGKPFFEGELRFVEKNLKDDLGKNNIIFVGSSNDLFQDNVPDEWVIKTLEHCNKYPENQYLFQSKNPGRFMNFLELFPSKTILGTTLETNSKGLSLKHSEAPTTEERAKAMTKFDKFRKTVTIEPIMEFDLDEFVAMIKEIRPEFVSIGADSKNHKLPEPSKEQIDALIKELKKFTEVKIKSNLNRITKNG